ncbi:MAG: penicillin-binding transpeptidase domain-containing protein [Lachnospiraceae bacterium]|nr:penicillin-binding transpeptidase domain-containing protein [Lachnospiraceae bacterium]
MIRPIWLILFLFVGCISGCANKKENSADLIHGDEKLSSESKIQTEEQIQTTGSAEIQNEIDLKNEFNDVNGCAVLYSVEEKEYLLYNSDMCRQEVSPYSTFKIISALAGLHNGVLQDETSKMNYTGNQYSVSDWNMDLGLKEAFQTSCIWYFRQVVDAVGADEIEKELNEISYGNCDVSEWEGSNINPQAELNGFWLGSSLKISPIEQVQILAYIFEGNSIYNANEINILKEIMLVDDDGTERIYGKTGSDPDGKAWFVGFSETDNKKKYFAVYLNDSTQEKNISGSLAKEIALKIK